MKKKIFLHFYEKFQIIDMNWNVAGYTLSAKQPNE